MDTPRYPIMFDSGRYEPLPLASLTLDSVLASLVAPYCLSVLFFTTTEALMQHGQCNDALGERTILAGDVLLFDATRTEPLDGAVQLVADGDGHRARICHILADGWVEFRAAKGYPVLSGERRIAGTLAAVVRATDGRPSEE